MIAEDKLLAEKTMFDLTGRTVLVIGGRGFLGRRMVRVLQDFGADVFGADLPGTIMGGRGERFREPSDSARREIDVDVTEEASIDEMVNRVEAESDSIDVLLYSVCAKPDDYYKPYTECSLDGWRKVIGAELDGLFLTTQKVGKIMERQKRGCMIFMSSIYGIVGNDQRIYEGSNLAEVYAKGSQSTSGPCTSPAVYNTVKGGVISLTRYLAAYWGHLGIRVNCISPGGLKHPGENEVFLKKYAGRVPLGRKAEVDEISGAVVFLASQASSYVTGHNLVVDGGWTAW